MKKWEYLIHQNNGTFGMNHQLNEWGRAGWELVSTFPNGVFVVFFLKREMTE